jgi:Na+/melibiose symporter-like transporter
LSSTSRATTAPRNGLGSKLAYASGALSFSVKDVAFGAFVLFYYTSVVGLQGSLAGAVLFIAMVWDALTDPIVGSISDNLRTRWGRRHPMMAISGIPLAICLFALFNVPEGLSEWGIFSWMLVVCLLLRTFLTLFTVPYLALGAELSNDYEERSSIAGVRTVFGWVSGILLTAAAWYFIFQSDGTTDGRLIEGNYFAYGALSFLLVAVFTTISIFATAGRIPFLPKGSDEPVKFSARKLVADIREALENHNFRTLFWLMLTLGAATGLNAALGTHVATYFWELSTEQLTLQALGTLVPIALMMVFMGWLNHRFEKQQVLRICILGLVMNTLWLVPGRLLGIIPENGHPLLFPLILFQGYLSAAFIIWFQTVSSSVIADISDEQEYLTHQRQEGMFFAAQGFSIKFVTGIGNFLGGVVIDIIRLPVGAVPGTVDLEVLFNLGIFMGPVIALFLVVPYFFSRRLRMSREQHAEIRAALDERSGAGDGMAAGDGIAAG